MTDTTERLPSIKPDGRRLTVGRSSGSDVLLTDPSVAPRHALLYSNSIGLHVTAIDWPVSINGRAVRTTRHLKHGDRLKIGRLVFLVAGNELIAPAESAAGINVEGLVVATAGRKILNGVSVHFGRGEFVGLLGPSGSGKSTLLRCLLGYTQPTEGTIEVGGLAIPDQAPQLWKSAGYVPQHNVLFPLLTVFENLDYSLRLREPAMPERERARIIAGRLEQLGIGAQSNDLVRVLSGGELRRVCVAQELLTAPTFLFLDEPTTGLDPANEARLMLELQRIAKAGVIVVCATHVLESAQLLDRAVILTHGQVAYDGKAAEMLQAVGAQGFRELYDDGLLRKRARASHAQSTSGQSLPPAIKRLERVSGMASQIVTLLSRGVRLLTRDLPWMAMLLLQPLVIGILIIMSQHQPTRVVESFSTFAAVAAVWLGFSNTARELVKERSHYIRERLFGMSSLAYVLSKCALFAVVGALQLALIVTILRSFNALDVHQRQDLAAVHAVTMWMCLFAAYLGAAFIGLCVSALARSQEWAVAVVPLLVLPQLLLTQEATGMTTDGRFESAYYMFDRTGQPSRTVPEWAVEACSLAMQTRPCVSLLSPVRPWDAESGRPLAASWTPIAVNVSHALLLIVLPGALLICLVRSCEPSWLKSFDVHK